MAKIIKVLVMVAFGTVLAVGGIQWTIQTGSMIEQMPVVIVTEDFNLIMQPVYGYGSWGSGTTFFPAIMGIIGGIVWISGVIGFANVSFPGAIWMTTGMTLIPIGILNFLRGLLINELWKQRAAYPSIILRFLFVEHPKVSIFIFAAAVLVCILIGVMIERVIESLSLAENKKQRK
jgi:hypothetical protein